MIDRTQVYCYYLVKENGNKKRKLARFDTEMKITNGCIDNFLHDVKMHIPEAAFIYKGLIVNDIQRYLGIHSPNNLEVVREKALSSYLYENYRT